MKKRIVSMMLAAMVALSVVGCGSKTLSNDYVTVKQYKGLEVAQVEKVEVTDEQVEQSVQANLNAAAEKEPIKDRAAEKGDWVNIDYTGYIDDVAFEGGTATGSDLELGSGSFIGAEGGYAGFEDQIIGHSTGEEFDIEVKFSDSYPGTDVAGKVARFHIVLNEIYKLKHSGIDRRVGGKQQQDGEKQRTNTAKKSVNRLKAARRQQMRQH